MKNKILMVISLGIFVASCNSKVETKVTKDVVVVNKDSIKTIIQNMENEYADALNAGNADAVMGYYANDAISYPPNMPPLVGNAAIREDVAKQIAESPKGVKVSFTTKEIHPSADGEMVLEIGSYNATDSINAKNYTGNYMSVFHKMDGKYVCVRDMAASDMPREKKEEKK